MLFFINISISRLQLQFFESILLWFLMNPCGSNHYDMLITLLFVILTVISVVGISLLSLRQWSCVLLIPCWCRWVTWSLCFSMQAGVFPDSCNTDYLVKASEFLVGRRIPVPVIACCIDHVGTLLVGILDDILDLDLGPDKVGPPQAYVYNVQFEL